MISLKVQFWTQYVQAHILEKLWGMAEDLVSSNSCSRYI